MSTRRTCAPLTRYCPSPPRCSRRTIETSENSMPGRAWSALSKRSSTSQKSAGERPAAPEKSTSSGFSARSSLGARLPDAQTSASAMFDLPEPFGPTTTATPGSSRTSVLSGNDLKPRSFMDVRCTRAKCDYRAGWGLRGFRRELRECLLRRRLLGLLLRAPRADAGLLPVDRHGAGERPVVRGPLDLDHGVPHLPMPARDRLLQLGLVVDLLGAGVRDAA